MSQATTIGRSADFAEQAMRDELAWCDAVLAGAGPVLRHLLAHDDCALFSDAVIARVRGMVLDLAAQLLAAQAEAAEVRDRAAFVAERQDGLAQALSGDTALLAHVHGLVLEALLAERLQVHSGLDAVRSPLIEQLTAGSDSEIARLAMALLAAQARFMQHVRRMELPLGELPTALFDAAVLALGASDVADVAERQLRAGYDAEVSRLGLLTTLLAVAAPHMEAMLSVEQAGLAIFASALARASGQERDLTVLSFADTQIARLALSLRAAGLKPQSMEEQFQHLHPGLQLPAAFAIVPADRAAALLSVAAV